MRPFYPLISEPIRCEEHQSRSVWSAQPELLMAHHHCQGGLKPDKLLGAADGFPSVSTEAGYSSMNEGDRRV